MKAKHRDRLYHFLLYSVCAFYIVFLMIVLFRTRHPVRSLNLIPFHSIMEYLSGDATARAFALSNVLGNIVLFIPLGVYLPLFRRDKRILTNTAWIALASLAVETVQYIGMMGIGDIDDVILNGLGGFIGAAACKLLLRQCGEETKAKRVVALAAPIGAALCFFILFLYNL